MADWLSLPQDLTQRILQRLSLPDRIRLTAVCRSWKSAVTAAVVSINEPQLPFLFVFSGDDDHKIPRPQLLCLSDTRTYLLHLPEMRRKKCFGTGSTSWLVFLNNNNLSLTLLNPYNRAQIPLPSLKTLPAGSFLNMLKIEIDWDLNPSTPMVMLIVRISRRWVVGFCRPGDEAWTILKSIDGFLNDILYYDGQFFVVDSKGEVSICLPHHNPPLASVALPPEEDRDAYFRWYLAASHTSGLFLVGKVVDYSDANCCYITKKFDIFKLNSSTHTWEEVKSLDDEMLFLGNNASICVSASNFNGWMGNCIYFIDDLKDEWQPIKNYWYHDLHIFNLKDGSIKPLCENMYHPTLMFPIWIAPPTFG